MTGRSLEKLLEAEARRRPEIAAMLDIIEHLSDHDIDTADVPLPWYRKALKVARDRKKASLLSDSFQAAPPVTRGVMPDMAGTQIIYRGETGWFNRGAHSGVAIQIPHGAHLFVTDHGTVWYNCTALETDERMRRSEVIEKSTLSAYKHAYNERMLKLHADAPVIASEQPDTPSGRLAQFGVSFF